MKRILSKIGIAIGVLFGTTIIVYAITSLFFTDSETSNFSKKTVFQFDLTTAMAGTEVEFTDVLFVDGKSGNPTVKGAKVVGTVEKHGRQKKIIVFKYRPKKKYRKTQGHRQPYTKVTIKKIVK